MGDLGIRGARGRRGWNIVCRVLCGMEGSTSVSKPATLPGKKVRIESNRIIRPRATCQRKFKPLNATL